MLDIDTGEQTEVLYKLYEVRGGKQVEKFKTKDINQMIKYQKWYAKRYQMGLYLEYTK